MTRTLPEDVQQVADQLVAVAGTFLHSTIHQPRITCAVCAAPVVDSALCINCQRHANSGLPLADRAGSLLYAVRPDSQAYRVLYNYKTPAAGPSYRPIVSALLAVRLRRHTECASRLAAARNPAWTVVPSTRGRSTLHQIVSSMAAPMAREIPVRFVDGAAGERQMNPRHWKIDAVGEASEHVLLVDDSWVTGVKAQSVASALKTAGAGQVSVFTIAKILEPTWEPSPQFIREHVTKPSFDPQRCPWTGGNCPE